MDSKTLLGAAAGAALAIGGMAIAEHYAGSATNAEQNAPAALAAPAGQPATPAPTATSAPAAVGDGYAEVRTVHPLVEQVTTPRKVCAEVTVRRRAPGSDNHVIGTVVGAAVGGLLGNQMGRGNGRKVTTAAGAVGGGFVGHEIGVRHDANNTTASTETRCRTVKDSSDKITAYDVTYDYQGRTYTTRMDHDPGPRIQVETTVSPVGMPTPAVPPG